mmetsp:Transcript_750/g.1068  ORF Transcript_750/g.1068 Transcript_750/m.1068 type:complete len:272 (-) Transcript_750:640-1455(-)
MHEFASSKSLGQLGFALLALDKHEATSARGSAGGGRGRWCNGVKAAARKRSVLRDVVGLAHGGQRLGRDERVAHALGKLLLGEWRVGGGRQRLGVLPRASRPRGVAEDASVARRLPGDGAEVHLVREDADAEIKCAFDDALELGVRVVGVGGHGADDKRAGCRGAALVREKDDAPHRVPVEDDRVGDPARGHCAHTRLVLRAQARDRVARAGERPTVELRHRLPAAGARSDGWPADRPDAAALHVVDRRRVDDKGVDAPVNDVRPQICLDR